MPFQISVIRHPGFVEFELNGEADIGKFVAMVDTVEKETVYWSDRLVLFNLVQVQGRLAPEDEVFLGEFAAQNLQHLERMASLVRPGEITRNSENAAQQLGTQLRVFTVRDEALGWLLGGLVTGDSVRSASNV